MGQVSHVWLVTTQFLVEKQGGIGSYCDNFIRNLDERGVKTTVFVTYNEHRKKSIFKHCEIIEINFHPKSIDPDLGYHGTLSLQFFKAIEKKLQTSTPDYIEFQDYKGIGYFLIKMKTNNHPLLASIPLHCTLHGPEFWVQKLNHTSPDNKEELLTKHYEYFTLKNVDSLSVPSYYLKKVILNNPFFKTIESKIKVIRNPLPEKQFTTTLSQPNHIVFFGKLTVQKGVLKFLDYYESFKQKNKKTELSLTLIGPDVYFQEAQQMMSSYIALNYSIPELRIVGNIGGKELKDTISSASVVIMPSIGENFPYAVLETIELNRIILCSNEGGQTEIISDNKNGFVFDINSETEFIKKLSQILGLTKNEKNRITLEAKKNIKELCDFDKNFSNKLTHIQSIQSKTKNNVLSKNLKITLLCVKSDLLSNYFSSFITNYVRYIDSVLIIHPIEDDTDDIHSKMKLTPHINYEIGDINLLFKNHTQYIFPFRQNIKVNLQFIEASLTLIKKEEIKFVSSWGEINKTIHKIPGYSSPIDLINLDFLHRPYILKVNNNDLKKINIQFKPNGSINDFMNIYLISTLKDTEIEIIPNNLFNSIKLDNNSLFKNVDLIPEQKKNKLLKSLIGEYYVQKKQLELINKKKPFIIRFKNKFFK